MCLRSQRLMGKYLDRELVHIRELSIPNGGGVCLKAKTKRRKAEPAEWRLAVILVFPEEERASGSGISSLLLIHSNCVCCPENGSDSRFFASRAGPGLGVIEDKNFGGAIGFRSFDLFFEQRSGRNWYRDVYRNGIFFWKLKAFLRRSCDWKCVREHLFFGDCSSREKFCLALKTERIIFGSIKTNWDNVSLIL